MTHEREPSIRFGTCASHGGIATEPAAETDPDNDRAMLLLKSMVLAAAPFAAMAR